MYAKNVACVLKNREKPKKENKETRKNEENQEKGKKRKIPVKTESFLKKPTKKIENTKMKNPMTKQRKRVRTMKKYD